MGESPRLRRLKADYRAMQQLRSESTIVDFDVPGSLYGGPPESYRVRLLGQGLWRPDNSAEPQIVKRHEVTIHLGASYPRMMPEIAWRSPVFHPNISAGGVVCLGGYSTHWVPSVMLDELCTMLWDMVRYQNFDVDSPYNRDAAAWARSQQRYVLPLDARPIRDKLAAHRQDARRAATFTPGALASGGLSSGNLSSAGHAASIGGGLDVEGEILIIDDVSELEVVEAEIVTVDQPDILFLD